MIVFRWGGIQVIDKGQEGTSAGRWDNGPARFRYQWSREYAFLWWTVWVPIRGATHAHYQERDRGHRLAFFRHMRQARRTRRLRWVKR
jgi:hypothetical protein